MKSGRVARLAAASLAALSLGLSVPFATAMEVKKFAIGAYTDECGGSQRSSWPNMVDGWYDEMDDEGHSKDGNYVDGNMTLQRFCDPDWNGDCNDDSFVDDADALIIATQIGRASCRERVW